MIYQNYNLNLIPGQVPISVWCSQYDKDSRAFRFTIYKGGELFFIPSGSTVTVRGTKQDNTGFEYSCTFDGTVVEVIVKDQMTIFAGKVPCEIRIANGSDILGTANFNLMVERTPLDTDVTISETDLPLLEEAEQNAIRAEYAASQATTVLASAVKSVNNVLPDSNGNVTIQAGAGLPSGGTSGQVLTKLSSADDDADWESLPTKMDLVSTPTNGHLLATNSSGQAVDSNLATDTVQNAIGSIAVIETSPATSAHAVGTYLVYNGKLYKVTSAISANEQLVVGTNIVATTVGDEISNGMKLLWENESPTSSFGVRQVTLPLANYKYVMVLFKMKASSFYRCSDLACVDAGTYVATRPNWDTNTNVTRGRAYVVRTNGIEFQHGYRYETYGTATEDDNSMIPIAIYGIY